MQNIFFTQFTENDLRNLLREELQKVLRQTVASDTSPNLKALNLNQAIEYTGFSKSHIYKLTSKGLIPHSKRGNKLFFDKGELDQWLLSNKVKDNKQIETETTAYLNKLQKAR